jgi:hypothetical protein
VTVLRSLLCATAATALLLPGCGGSGAQPPATRSPSAALRTPRDIDLNAVNAARDAFVAACRARETGDGSAPLSDARRAAATLIAAVKANPDEPFRRSPKAPAVTMRDRVRAAALIARTQCGDRAAARLGDRLARAAARASA